MYVSFMWCDILRETLCVPSIYRRVRVRSCTAGQVTSVKIRFRYDLWAEHGLPTAKTLTLFDEKVTFLRPMGLTGLTQRRVRRRDTSLKTDML